MQEEKQLALKTEAGCFSQREVGESLEFWLLPDVCGWFEVGHENGKGGSLAVKSGCSVASAELPLRYVSRGKVS